MVEILITQNTKNGKEELILIKDKNFIHLQKEEVEKLAKFFFARLNPSQETKSVIPHGLSDSSPDTHASKINDLMDKDYCDCGGLSDKDWSHESWCNANKKSADCGGDKP